MKKPVRKLTTVAAALFAILIMTSGALAADPGLAVPATSEGHDQRAGSLLIYNIYTSSATGPNTQNTQINITNTSDTSASFVHIFFVDGSTCAVADRYACLTANQTLTMLTSEQDPGTTGYIIVNAVDFEGLPAQFNFLIGDEYIKFATGHTANLGAEAYAKLTNTNLVSSDGIQATLVFDGGAGPGSYNRISRVLAVDNIGSTANGNNTVLVINRIGGSLMIGAATLGTLFGIVYDDAETPYSFIFPSAGCQLRGTFSVSFPRVVPRFDIVIPAGQTGWMKIFSPSDIGITGSVLNFNANAATAAGAFGGGHNLHKLRLTAAATYVIPIFGPGC